MCTVYLWDYHDKVVISDIDGTITRSDVAGQVLPLVGMDWTQNGVVWNEDTIFFQHLFYFMQSSSQVELFNSVACNGYRVLYLSARAIGQVQKTPFTSACCMLENGIYLVGICAFYISC